jgi:hypothetical protein
MSSIKVSEEHLNGVNTPRVEVMSLPALAILDLFELSVARISTITVDSPITPSVVRL